MTREVHAPCHGVLIFPSDADITVKTTPAGEGSN
jgi:hypothetical protein